MKPEIERDLARNIQFCCCIHSVPFCTVENDVARINRIIYVQYFSLDNFVHYVATIKQSIINTRTLSMFIFSLSLKKLLKFLRINELPE